MIFKPSFIYFLSQLIIPLFNLITVPLLTKILSPEDYGYFVIYLSSFNFMMMFGNSWMVTTILRFYSKVGSKKSSVFLSNLFFLQLVLWVLVSFLFYLLSLTYPIFPNSNELLKKILFILFLSSCYFEIFLGILRAKNESLKYSIVFLLFNASKVLLALVLLYLFQDIKFFFLGWSLVSFLFFFMLFFKQKKELNIKQSYINLKELKKIIKYGIPFIFTSLGGFFISQVDRYMILDFLGPSMVGVYNISNLIASYSVGIFSTSLIMSSYPVIISKWENNCVEKFNQYFNKQIDLFMFFCIPAFVGILFVSDNLINIAFSKDYISGNKIVKYVALASLLSGYLQYQQKSFVLKKETGAQGVIYCCGAILNLVANYLLIPKFGILGASIATLLSFVFIAILIFTYNFKKWNIFWVGNVNQILKILLSAVAMSVVLSFINSILLQNLSIYLQLLLKIICGAFAYISFSYILKIEVFIENFDKLVLGFKKNG